MSPCEPIATHRLLQTTSVCALIIGAALVAMPQAASAQAWTGGVSSDYANGGNWSGGVTPAAGAVVTINTNANAPVVDTGDNVNGGQLSVGPTAAATLTVRGGGTLTASSIGVGGGNDGTGGNGTLIVTGAGSLATVASQVFVGIRDGSTGLLTIADGATLRASSLMIGGGNGLGIGATGTVTVTGAGSLLDFTSGLLSMGGNTVNPGHGTLNILAGGQVVGGSGTTNFIRPLSAINIRGANSSLSANSNLALDGALLIEDGGALTYATIVLGGTATLLNAALAANVVGSAGGFGISAGGTLVADGSTITVGSNFSVAGSATLRGTALSAAAIGISQNGILNIGGADGAAAGAAGTLTAQSISIGDPNSRLVFNHTGPDLVVGATIGGNGRVLHRSGTTILTAANPGGGSVTGIDVTGGTLLSNGGLRANNVTVSGGGALGGIGLVEGSIAVTDGIIAPGSRGVGTLTLGNLSLTGASVLNFDLGAPGTPGVGSDLITLGNLNTGGNLTLDGTLNVANVGGFGAGLYRLIDYKGALTDNGLTIGTTPTGFAPADLTVQTSIARQVNLVVGSPISATFWDGADTTGDGVVNGGTGTWTTTGANWTLPDGSRNGAYDPTQLLIFSGTGGTVTIDNAAAPVTVGNGLQFATNGYSLVGGALDLTGANTVLRIGDGTAAGAGIIATIGSALTGTSGLEKTDLGTLRLTGANTYSGETRVLAGNLTLAGGTAGGALPTSTLRVAPNPGSTANVAVTDGAVLTSTGASVAPETNSTGTVTVSGAGSRWNIVGAGGVRIGSFTATNAQGLVEILDGGVMNYGADFSFAPVTVAQGSTLRVSGAGSRFDASAIVLFNQGGGGALLLENGGVARVENAEFGDTSALTIRSGARLETTSGSSLSFGAGSLVLVTGTGTQLNASGPLSIDANAPGQDFVIDDNAVVTSTANTDSRIAFGGARRLIVRNGAQLNLTGGTGAGLQMDAGTLLVEDASVTLGGQLQVGTRFPGNVVTLLNANLTAGSLITRFDGAINLGGTRTGAAGAVGDFVVPDVTIQSGSEFNLNHTSNRYVIASQFASGGSAGGRINVIAGNTVFSGDSAGFAGNTQVTGGSLIVNGRLASETEVTSNATLGGTGTLGNVRSTGGRIAPGDNGVGTLTVTGSLTLDAASRLAFDLGASGTPGVGSDLIDVGGDLTLDGALDLTDAGGFGAGLYRLINYDGTLTDNLLNIATVPSGFGAGDLTVQTSVARQVNLLVGAPAPTFSSFSFWDGVDTTANRAIDGGAGAWTATGRNWTVSTGEANGVYDPTQLLIFSGAGGDVNVDTAPGPVTVSRGLQFAANGYGVTGGDLTLGANPIVLRVGDGTAAGASVTATIASNLIGGASIEKTDLGALVLTGDVAPTGDTTITAGTLQVGAGGATGSIGGNIVNNGALVFNRAGTLDYAGIVSGSGTLEQRGPGTLALIGANTYTGGTTVSGGTLRGSTISLTGPITIGATGALQFDQTAEGAFGGVFTGSGVLRKTGTGTLSITGASSDFSGVTRVEAGTLAVIGALGGGVIVQAPATLIGTGRVGALDVAGRVSPGGVIGALNVTGDVVFRAGSTYAVDLAAAGDGDRILAGGRATLEGGTVAITTLDPETDYRDGSNFRILNAAGGLTGTFAGLTETSAFLDFTLAYDATGASITIAQARTFPDVARTFNQGQAADALEALDRTAGSDALAVYNELLMLDENSARNAFDASSGEIYASVIDAHQRAAIGLTGQFATRGRAALSEGLGVWGGLTGYDGRVAGDGNGGRIDADALGGELGVDYRGEANVWAVGVGGGWQSGDVELASRDSDAEVDGWHLGGYARYGSGAAGFTVLATGVHVQADADFTRRIGFGAVARTARADADLRTTALGLDLRYGFGGGKVTFGPTSSIQHASNRLDRFSERGADALALSAGQNRDDWTRFGIGGFARITSAAGYIDLSARMVTGDRSDASATLTMAGSTQGFTVRAARGAATAAEVQLSTEYGLGNNWWWSGRAGFIGGDGDAEASGSVRIGVRF